MLDISLIILSAGDSSRFGIKTKKQWLRVGDVPLWHYVTEKLSSFYAFKDVFVTGSEEELRFMQKFSNAKIIKGGATRQESLKNALENVNTKYVLVSDAARFGVPEILVENLINEAENADVIAPFIAVSDTAIYEEKAIVRENVKLIQTPQLSLTRALKNALLQNREFTDESSAVKANGGSVKYIKGDEKAHKLTISSTKNSMLSTLMPPSKHTFNGIGFDVHAYEPNKKMVLGGVAINEDFGFKAHSDGDVLIHALIDALLGAAGAGDIGEWFPDFDSKYKNADSSELLKQICIFLSKTGYEILHCDLTVMAQKPKIEPYKKNIAKKLAEVMQISASHINIKATTTERLGFIGRSEGAAVLASATLKYYDWMSDENINR